MVQERLVKRRLPSVEKSIVDIQPESDVRVRITGTVIDTNPNSVVVDDGTSKLEVFFGEDINVAKGQFVRVVARILPLIDGFECRGEVLQVLDGFNMNLYKKARGVIKNL